jgi:hypothetical protein
MLHQLATAMRRPWWQTQELERLERRIVDVRYCIEQARDQHGWPGDMPERERMLALLKATLKALEVHEEALMGGNQ